MKIFRKTARKKEIRVDIRKLRYRNEKRRNGK